MSGRQPKQTRDKIDRRQFLAPVIASASVHTDSSSAPTQQHSGLGLRVRGRPTAGQDPGVGRADNQPTSVPVARDVSSHTDRGRTPGERHRSPGLRLPRHRPPQRARETPRGCPGRVGGGADALATAVRRNRRSQARGQDARSHAWGPLRCTYVQPVGFRNWPATDPQRGREAARRRTGITKMAVRRAAASEAGTRAAAGK